MAYSQVTDGTAAWPSGPPIFFFPDGWVSFTHASPLNSLLSDSGLF